MAKFFFHICGAASISIDDEGVEFSSLEGARDGAVAIAKSIVKTARTTHEMFGGKSVEVTDDSGKVVFTYSVSDAAP